ncbi:branched-chain amino acid ABC transporter permease [Castellaniella defragrans]|uniref:branched-chain amino acid ABC transporter permease n=1 Tax=Castellaniella defragrans TaxID=75697 RepID=UPI0023F51DC5|nr:branched-chain amino acid ABC transporter permease [Castellaniella defragrans]
MTRLKLLSLAALALLIALPYLVSAIFPSSERYYLHLIIQTLLWAQIYTAWSIMGRYGLTSLGHGAFTGIGAYVTVMLWNLFGLTPLLGIPFAIGLAVLFSVIIGYPSFAQRIKGHYFALLTLAMVEFVRLCIIGLRDYTGGSLGTQPIRYGNGLSLYAVQFETNRHLAYIIVLIIWLLTLAGWQILHKSIHSQALEAINENEEAAAAIGINVTWEKLKVTMLSAALSALGGAIFAQYQMYIGPETIAGLNLSLGIVFGVVAGGIGVLLGPTVGAILTQTLSEGLRVAAQGSTWLEHMLGSGVLSLDGIIYGLLLVLFIIYMPRGILGTLLEVWTRKPAARHNTHE